MEINLWNDLVNKLSAAKIFLVAYPNRNAKQIKFAMQAVDEALEELEKQRPEEIK